MQVNGAVRSLELPMADRYISGWRQLLGGLRRTPGIDVVLASAAFAGLLVDPVVDHGFSVLTPAAVVLALLAALPLLARRQFPLGVLIVVVPLLLACLAVFHPNRAAVGVIMLLVFTVGLEGDRSRSLAVAALMTVVVTVAVVLTARRGTVADVVAFAALVLGALFAGEALRARQALERAVADQGSREREAAAQHRFDEQRLGWAHELHDIVGHTLVAINVRASAAAHLDRRRGGSEVTTALDDIASASAGALAELRSTLKDLRTAQAGPAPLHPVQELADLNELVASLGRGGLAVELDIGEMPESLRAAVSHAGYRIVQEGLTNVLRHSSAEQACVQIGVEGGALVVEVRDDGRRQADTSHAGGHGLQGMKERAAALGGTCEAGPVNGAGWRVRARIPVGDRGS
jgi:signal transduction histidine kinase